MKKSGFYTGFVLLVAPLMLFAQLGGTGEEVNLIVNPPYPRAGDTVSLKLESYAVDINSSDITWTINGEVKKQGIGEKTLSATLDSLGSGTVVQIAVQTQDNRVLEKTVTLRPANVELLWQTGSYTPPFYRGKALFPYQGTAFVAAVPFFVNAEGQRIKPENLLYKWSEGDKTDGTSSGYGKSLFLVQGTIPIRPKTVSVEVSTPDRSLVAFASTHITPLEPRVLLYENHPLYGLRLEKALDGSIPLIKEEIKISAVPFYFDIPRKGQALLYTWSLNSSLLPDETSANITLRRSSDRGGRASLSLEVQNAEPKTFQAGRVGLQILMEEQLFDVQP